MTAINMGTLGFNEAATKRSRRSYNRYLQRIAQRVASMRPRPSGRGDQSSNGQLAG